MSYQKLIYLASPYSHSDPDIVRRRVAQTQSAVARLIEEGNLVFSPIVHSDPIHHLVKFNPHNTEELSQWMQYDKAFISKCDELWVLKLDGWETSAGVDEETFYAYEHGIPVQYVDYPSLRLGNRYIKPGISEGETQTVNVEFKANTDVLDRAVARLKEARKLAYQTEAVVDRINAKAESVKEPLTEELANARIDAFFNAEPSGRPIQTQGDRNSEVDDVFGCNKDQADGLNTSQRQQIEAWSATFRKACRLFPNFCDGKSGLDAMLDLLDSFTESYTVPETYKPAKLIGLTGHAQSGKDTAGKYLVENHGFVRIGLADAVKEALYALNPQFRSDVTTTVHTIKKMVDDNGWEYAKLYTRVREYLQKLGTEVGRNIFGEDCWIRIAERKIKELGPEAKVVITDVRFPNEAEWVRSLGGEVWEIRRSGVGPVNGHASDQKLDGRLIDKVVFNDAELSGLYAEINHAFERNHAAAQA